MSDKIMERAQVFASAWSLVGGRFDAGNGIDEANAAKAELRQMVEQQAAELAALRSDAEVKDIEIATLRCALAVLHQHAARYGWLRRRTPGGSHRIDGVTYSDGVEHVDAQIDAAMAVCADEIRGA